MPDGSGAGGPPDNEYLVFRANARDIERAFLAGLAPAPPLDIPVWAEEHIKFPEGSPCEGEFRLTTAPYIEEILRAAEPDSGVTDISVPKCVQSSGTTAADIILAARLTTATIPAMVVHPTVGQFQEWAESKFWKMARASSVLDPEPEDDEPPGALLAQTGRTEGGSTRKKIKWKRGSTILGAGAESPATLRQHTIRLLIRDDIDGWSLDAGGEGDPLALSEGRLTTYREMLLALAVNISTPLVLRGSRVLSLYGQSDQGRYYMGCTDCGARTDFDWEDVQRNPVPPYECHVVCPVCGVRHYSANKRKMIAKASGAGWIATRERDGVKPPKTIKDDTEWERWRTRDMGPWAAHRGFWITGMISRFLNWDRIAREEDAAAGDPKAEMVFQNNYLGRGYDVKTLTPDWEVLAARARNTGFRRGVPVWGPLVFTLSVDVQRDGLYFLAKGYNANEEAWYLDYGFIAGETAEPGTGAWTGLTNIAERGVALPGGAVRDFDIEVVDSNYNTDAAKAWVRVRGARAIAINGEAGWGKPIIYRATESDLKASGKRRRYGGVKIWHVGTYPAKAVLVARYAKTLEATDETGPPRGFCWFPEDAEEAFFRQLTAEYVHEETLKSTGLTRSTWKARGDNHWFDCDVYSLAGLDKLGARAGKRGSWSDDDWAIRERDIRAAIEAAGGQPDLFDIGRAIPPKPDTPGEPRSHAGDSQSRLPAALARQARLGRR